MAATSEHRRGRWLVALVVMTLAWLTVLRWPTPQAMIADGDWVHQLAGANQILHGEHPYIDWRTDFGPLRYYPSAWAQALLGPRSLAELLLVSLAYVVAYGLLFTLARRAAGHASMALAALAFALVLPPHLFKYYVALAPMLCLAAMWRYIDRPDWTGLLLLSGTVALSGLFRADFGAYAGVGALAAVALTPVAGATRARQLIRAAVLLLVWLTPWLLWLIWHGALAEYVVDTLVTMPRHASGMALPLPRPDLSVPLDAQRNGVFWLYLFFCLLPPIVALLARRSDDAGERRRMLATAALCVAVLGQSMHRANYTHLYQAIVPSFVLVAWLLGRTLAAWRERRYAGAALATSLLGVGIAACVSAAQTRGFPGEYQRRGLETWRLHARPRIGMLRALAEQHPRDPWIAMLTYVRDCTDPEARIVALRRHGAAYYFADRRFGGGQPTWSPGFFNSASDQRRWIETAQRDDVRLVIGDLEVEVDGRSERRFSNFAQLVTDYIRRDFAPIGVLGDIQFRVRSPLAKAAAGPQPPPCLLRSRPDAAS
jgi:hypothetical protein